MTDDHILQNAAVVPIGLGSGSVWDATDYRIARRRLDARLRADQRNRQDPDDDPVQPLPGDLICYTDATVHRYAGIGLSGNPVIAPETGNTAHHTGFELADFGELDYVGPAYDPHRLACVPTNEFRPATAWSWHHDTPGGTRVLFTIPVRVWTVETIAPAHIEIFGYGGTAGEVHSRTVQH